MLPAFLDLNLVNSYLFLDWDNGRRIVDFNGQPATVQSNEAPVWEFLEDTCPGHIAYADNPKLCGRCGIHIDSLRPDDLAPQALTDTGAQPDEPTTNVPTSEQLYNRQVMKAGGSITTNYMQDGSIETYATLPHEPVAPAAGVTPSEPATDPARVRLPQGGWRRW